MAMTLTQDDIDAIAAAILVTPANKLATTATGEAAANVTMQNGVAVAAADANGNVPVVLYGTQGAVTFGQVKITANVNHEGALHIRNNATLGNGVDAYAPDEGLVISGANRGVRLEGGTNQALFLLSDTAAATVYIEGPTTGGKGLAISSPSDGTPGTNSPSGIYIQTEGGHPGIVFDFANPATAIKVLGSEHGDWSVDAMLDGILVDTGTTIPGLLAGVGSGSGTGYYSDTVDDGTSPLDGVRVQLYTAPDRVGLAYEAYTDALGVFEMWPDTGTYYRWLDLAGYSFTQDVEVEVTEP